MKFKVCPEKYNLFFMSTLIILCFFTCTLWLVLREYYYFIFYFLLTLIIAHIYYFTTYIINDQKLILKLGFIRVNIKYEKILKVIVNKKGIKIYLKYIKFNIYPDHQDQFILKLEDKLTNKNSCNIIKNN